MFGVCCSFRGPYALAMANAAYDALIILMSEEEGVTVEDNELLVHGKVFAYLDGSDLIVEVPDHRAVDLRTREVAEAFVSDGHPARDWVRVSDEQLWPELAREAHEFVGEPAVGGQS